MLTPTPKERIQIHITATIRAIDSAQDADYKAFQEGKLYGLKEALFIIDTYEETQSQFSTIEGDKNNEATNHSNTNVNNSITHTKHYIQSTQHYRGKGSTD